MMGKTPDPETRKPIPGLEKASKGKRLDSTGKRLDREGKQKAKGNFKCAYIHAFLKNSICLFTCIFD